MSASAQGKIIPAGSPFILDLTGKQKKIDYSNQKETIDAYMKYAYRIIVHGWQSSIVGGRFQFANNADLSDTVTVHKISKVPFYNTEVQINQTKKFRYLIFNYKGINGPNLAEMAFYTKNKFGEEIKLNGSLIGAPGMYTVNNTLADKRYSCPYF